MKVMLLLSFVLQCFLGVRILKFSTSNLDTALRGDGLWGKEQLLQLHDVLLGEVLVRQEGGLS